jgi:hypothetical protein
MLQRSRVESALAAHRHTTVIRRTQEGTGEVKRKFSKMRLIFLVEENVSLP